MSGIERERRGASLAVRGAHTLERNWPALEVGSVCVGLGLSNWVSAGRAQTVVFALIAVLGVALFDGSARVLALAVALLAVGLWWGSLRLEAMGESALSAEVGSAGSAEIVVTGPARHSVWSLRVPAEVRAFRGQRLRERVLLLLPVERSPPQGAILEAEVIVSEPRDGTGGFDERAWLARQGIHVVLRARDWHQVGHRGGVAGLGDRLRDRVQRAIESGTSGQRRALVLGIVLGEDEDLSTRVRQDFRASGLYHLLAVSGQNVAFIAGGVFGIGWLLRLPRVARELVAICGIAAYVLAVGWQPSVVRAGVAGLLASAAWLFARPRDRWYFLALGALVLLAWAPSSVLEPGFQLSFAAVAAIFAALPRTRGWLEGYPIPARLGDVLAVALVCGLVTAPIVLADFGVAPVYTVPANALAEPAMPLVLGLGLLGAVTDPVAPGAAAACAWLAGWAASWIELVARVFASLPGARVGPRGALLVLLLAAATWAFSRRRRIRTHG